MPEAKPQTSDAPAEVEAWKRLYEQTVRENQERFRAFMNHNPAVVFMKDSRLRFVYINRSFERLFGITLEKIWGTSDFDWFPESVACETRKNDTEVLRTGKSLELLEIVPTPDGRTHYWSVQKFLFTDADGHKFIGGIATDVTERHIAEASLRAETDRLSAVIAAQQEVAGSDRSLDAVMNIVARRAQEITRASGAVVELIEGDELVYRAMSGIAAFYPGLRLKIADSFSGFCVREGQAVRCNDSETDERVDRALCRRVGIRSMLIAPLQHRQKIIGTLKVYASEPSAFQDHDLAALQLLASLIAAAMSDAAELEAEQKLAAERAAALETAQRSERILQEQATLQRAILDSANYSIITINADGLIMTFNAAAERMLGYTAQEVVGKATPAIFHDEQEIMHRAAELTAALGVPIVPGLEVFRMKTPEDKTEEREWTHIRKDGSRFPILLSVNPLRDAAGSITGFLGIGSDITERKRAEAALRESDAVLQSFYHSSPLMMGVAELYANDILFISANLATAAYFGMKPQVIQNLRASDLGGGPEDIAPWIENYLTSEREGKPNRFELQHHNGAWLSATVSYIGKAPNGQSRYSFVVNDITERRWLEDQIESQIALVNQANVEMEWQQRELAAANARLEALATTDGLTGLKNHRAFQEFLEQEFQRTVRTRQPLSVILLDVDKFKKYNDTFGHPAGDEVLKTVARVLQSHARTTDCTARYGGEEFVIVLPDTDAEGAVVSAERFRSAIENAPLALQSVTASFGISTFSPLTADQTVLVSQADEALYASKQQGRNRVTHYESLHGMQENEPVLAQTDTER